MFVRFEIDGPNIGFLQNKCETKDIYLLSNIFR